MNIKRRILYSLVALIIGFSFSVGMAKAQQVDYKAKYKEIMKKCADTQSVINQVVQWLKQHHYEKYKYPKAVVEDALDQAKYAAQTKKKAESLASKGDYKAAYGWANMYWQYQIKVATKGLQAKQMITDIEAKK